MQTVVGKDKEQAIRLGVLSFSASEATCSYDWAEE